MAKDPTSAFIADLAAYLAADKNFLRSVASKLTAQVGGGGGAATTRRRPGRPAGGGGGGGGGGGSTVDRVYALVKGGAQKRAEICAKAHISPSSYSYAIKVLKEQGKVKVVGSRRGARVVPA